MNRTVIVVQARMTSTRLPGKVLLPLGGRPTIVFLLQRLGACRAVDEVILATSDDPSDDPLVRVVEDAGFLCHRGSLVDVLDRYHGAVDVTGASVVVRVTGDCPLLDPTLVDELIRERERLGVDYMSNVDPPTFPDGLDAECFSAAALERAWREASDPSDREHVTPYLRRPEAGFRTGNLTASIDWSALRWTVDYADDYQRVVRIWQATGFTDPRHGDRFDLLRVVERDRSLAGAGGHVRNEGSQRDPRAHEEDGR